MQPRHQQAEHQAACAGHTAASNAALPDRASESVCMCAAWLPIACLQATAKQCAQLCVVICLLPGCSVYARGFMEQFRIMLWKFNIVYWRLPEYNGVR